MCDTFVMTTTTPAPSYKRYRYPAEIIAHTIWLYFRFNLSFRDVEELMAARGVLLSYETVRRWTLKFGQQYANELRRRYSYQLWWIIEICRSSRISTCCWTDLAPVRPMYHAEQSLPRLAGAERDCSLSLP